MKKKEAGSIYTELDARIIPKSSRNEIIFGEGDPVKIKVTSPPVDGKANKAVVNLLAKQLKVSKKDIQIVSGEKSRNKKIRINGISKLDLLKVTG
jgi:uncharacterized protein